MKDIEELRQHWPEEFYRMAEDIHGHISPGIALGFKMILYALSRIKITPADRIIITAESVRCLQDAAFIVSHYLINENGWRIYPKVYDVGKLSIQVAKNVRKGKPEGNAELFRVILDRERVGKYPLFYLWAYQEEKKKAPLKDLIEDIKRAEDNEVFKIVPFSGKMTELCHVKSKNLKVCPECGEYTENITMLEVNGRRICRICAFFEKPEN